ncbi:DUF6923 family protein [Lysobacter firmicutimachus]|uniref:DUF11 domain-containing protein n=1 Tax=Lysobacter firmicutimachus TaxID=1792846 RepID=A0ABU8DAE2_9GAMM
MRLSTNQVNQSGTALYTGATFPSTQGVVAEFDYVSWGGTGADGLSFFLYDAASNMAGAGTGGALGYCAGAGGYLGIGLDEWGNYSNTGGNSCASATGIGYVPDSVAVRGPVSSGNPYVGGQTLAAGIDDPGVLARPSINRVRVALVPNGTGGYRVSVGLGTTATNIVNVLSNLNFPYAAPTNLRMGFASATGDETNIHEIRNVTASVPADVAVTKTVASATLFRGQTQTYTVVVRNNDINPVDPGDQSPPINAANAPDISDALPAQLQSVSWTCAASAGSTCPAASGTGNIAIAGGYTLATGGQLTFTITGTVAATATCGATVTNTATADFSATDGFSDINVNNNSASAVFTVACADLAISKTNNQTIYAPGQSISYVLVASNAGPAAVTNAVFADPAIANFNVTGVTCASPVGGAVCPAVGGAPGQLSIANMQGSGVNIPSLPTGGSVTFTVSGTVASNATGNLTNTAQIALPNGGVDSTPANNTASDTDTPQPNFGVCDSRLWLEQSPGAPTPTTLYQINTNANPLTFTPIGAANLLYNAVGYNPSDNYQYGLVTTNTNTLVKIGADGSAISLGAVSGLPVATYISGAFGTAGNILYVKDNVAAGTTMYAINVTTLTATAIPLSTAINIADWAWVNGLLYSVTNGGQLVSVNPTTGAVTSIGAPNGLPAGFFGAIYGAPNGLYGSGNNPPSGFYKFDLATGAATLISGAPGSSANDGSNCPTANITFGADLQITKTNTPASGPNDLANDRYTPGTARTYTVVVTNAGPFGAANAVFTDPAIANFTVSSVTCGSPTGGGVCPSVANTTVALMQGGGIVIPSLPYSSNTSSSVTFTVTGTIAAGATGALTNVANIAAGAGTSDATPGNNSATDTDTPTGTIVIVKDAVPNDAQDFAFTTTGTGLSAFSLDDDADGTLQNTRTFTGLEPGSYGVTEAVTAGWSLTALSCSDPDNGTVVDLTNRLATIDIDSGETVTCTYTNGRLPILRLQKALPLGRFVAADQFALSIAGSGGPASVTTTGSGTTATGAATLNPGAIGAAYTFSEAAAAGADLANYAGTYACTNALAGGQAPSGSGTTFNLTAAAGDDLSCTFTNTRNPIADLSITKTNTPGSGPNDQAGDTLTRGASTTYTIVVTNNGPDTVAGAILVDPPGGRSGLSCTAPPVCTGAACPAGLTLAQLESGVALGALANGATVTVTLSCTVN